MLVQQLLETSARRLPGKIAVVAGERRATYRFIDEAANRLAAGLLACGLKRGDRVMILLESSIETVISIFGTLKAGGVFVVLHPSTKHEKLEQLLDDAQAAALISDRVRLRNPSKLLGSAASLHTLVWTDDTQHASDRPVNSLRWSDLVDYSAEQPPCSAIDADLATLLYTSGSTGRPKGVMSTHLNMITATNSINAYVGNVEDDVILNVLPLSFDYGLYQVLLAFQVGARVVLEPGFEFPARTVEVIEREGVTGLPAVPTLVALLLKYPRLLKREFRTLRYITNTAAALPVSHILRLRESLPSVRIISMYGLTECKRVSYLPPEQLDIRPNSVGIAIPNTEAYIVDNEGERVPPGVEGELVVRGSHVTRGYWRAPELTAEKFRPGDIPGETVLYTGDIFCSDQEGFLYFVRRKDDVVKTRGQKVSPREVEDAVHQLDGVAEAVVLGIADDILGEAIVLVVAPKPDVDLGAVTVRAHCKKLLDDYMQPKYVDIVHELPRTDNGKVDKERIREELWALVAADVI